MGGLFDCHSVAAAEAEKKPEEEEKKKSPSPQKGEAPEIVEKFPDTVSFHVRCPSNRVLYNVFVF